MIELFGAVLKVLHINSFDKKGGAETVFQISKNFPGIDNYSGYVETSRISKKPDISFHSWESYNKFIGILNYIFSLKNYNALRSFLKTTDVDVIHLHGFFSSISPSILLAIKKAKQKKKIKVVQTLHDFHLICPNASLYNYNKNVICEKCIGNGIKLSILFENCDRRGWAFSIIKGLRSFVANNILHHKNIIDTFICPSEFLKSKLIEDGIGESRITVIRNPISFTNDFVIPPKKNIICYFGRFSKEKNLEFLINTFNSWKLKFPNDFKLFLIGEGEEESTLKSLASECSTKNDIYFISFLPYDKLVTAIQDVKYLAMTSMCYENAPMSVIEGMSLNIIPIVPSIGGMKESVETLLQFGKTYLPNNIDSWIDSICYLEENYNEQIKKLVKSKINILEEAGIESYFRKVFKIYQ